MSHQTSDPLPIVVKDHTCFSKWALYDWDGDLEIAGVKIIIEDGKEYFERIEEDSDETPDFWSVYCHQHQGGAQCVGDFNTLEQATEFHNFLRAILSLDLPSLPLN